MSNRFRIQEIGVPNNQEYGNIYKTMQKREKSIMIKINIKN